MSRSGRRSFIPLAVATVAVATVVELVGLHAHQTPAAAPAPVLDRALIDKYCVSCHNERLKTAGLTLDKGLTTTRRALADTLNAARAVSARTVGLIDSSKFGRSSLLSIAQAQELDAIVVDGGLAPDTFDEYAGAGVSLVRADARAAASLT